MRRFRNWAVEWLRGLVLLIAVLIFAGLLGFPVIALIGLALHYATGFTDHDGFGYWMHSRLWAASSLAWGWAAYDMHKTFAEPATESEDKTAEEGKPKLRKLSTYESPALAIDTYSEAKKIADRLKQLSAIDVSRELAALETHAPELFEATRDLLSKTCDAGTRALLFETCDTKRRPS